MRISRRMCSQLMKEFENVRVRFAPSPTGRLHLGGLRTALFNYLFAKRYGGSFVLRIEDTDQQRLSPGSADQFERILDDFKISPDESPSRGGRHGPYVQSQRLHLYAAHSELLMDKGVAYRCFCSNDRLDILRKNALKKNETPRYDNRCRSLSQQESDVKAANMEPFVVRFKFERGQVHFEDAVYGHNTQTVDEGDFVIVKSDRFPTYHFANVVDDHLMDISHVIRGMEWLPSTPKHVRLYNAFEWKLPRFCHLPLIMKTSRQKLSKRDAAAYVGYYTTEKGYLSVAILNYLLRNGSGIARFDKEKLYSVGEMAENFDVNEITSRSLLMDDNALEMYGKLAFQHADKQDLLTAAVGIVRTQVEHVDPALLEPEYVDRVIQFLGKNEESFACLSELSKGDFGFFFGRPSTSTELLTKYPQNVCKEALDELLSLPELSVASVKTLAQKMNLKGPQLMSILRFGLIGSLRGPPLSELFGFFTQEECRTRLAHMRDILKAEALDKDVSERG